ncbi:hypothetical protein [Aquincola sp. J276]|uniref:hypothetical protein n=1 Tax=Aquincola sp. J276 TaxID=2898432 RepID=UPI00215107DF|nr:hypothetical protein [Aquincola sp. J276]MCR5865172.1 hypothetical protein [Aquincola sp. J276]
MTLEQIRLRQGTPAVLGQRRPLVRQRAVHLQARKLMRGDDGLPATVERDPHLTNK